MDKTQCLKEFMAFEEHKQLNQYSFTLQCGKCHDRDMARVLWEIQEGHQGDLGGGDWAVGDQARVVSRSYNQVKKSLM